MRRILILLVLCSVCQAPPPSPQVTSKDSSSTSENIMTALKKTATKTFSMLQGWYGKTREYLWGPDGFFTTLYHSSGEAPKSKSSRARCCRHRPRTYGSSYPYTGTGTTTPIRTNYYIFMDSGSNNDCCSGVDCSCCNDCCSSEDCTQCVECFCGVLTCLCDPDVICS